MSEEKREKNPDRIKGKLGQLPSLPQAAETLMREVLKDEPDLAEVGRIVTSDPALSARVLRLVNSPHYGVRWKVSTIDHAVNLLGIRAIESIVLSITVFDMLGPSKAHTLDMTRHWQHSLAVASAARYIAEKTGDPSPEEAYTAGMLHDVARAALDVSAPDDLRIVLEAIEADPSTAVEAERGAIGIDHAEAGGFLLSHWNMHERVVEAVTRHHGDTLSCVGGGTAEGLAGVLQAADLAAWSAGLGGLATTPRLAPAEAVREFVDSVDRAELVGEMESELRRAAELFGVKVPDGVEVRGALAATTAELSRIVSLQKRVEERLAEKTQSLQAIRRLAAGRADGGGRVEVIGRSLKAVTDALGAERAAFFDRATSTGELTGTHVEDVTGLAGDIADVKCPPPEKDTRLERSIAVGEPVRISAEDGRVPLLEALGSSEALAAPVSVFGKVDGVIVVDNSLSGKSLAGVDMDVLFVLANETGIALENAVLQVYSQELKSQAETDTLTELNNRRNLLRILDSEIQRGRRYKAHISLVMIDIDHFKGFNDTYGHQAGDQLLKMLGALLRNSCRNIDTPGRLGGEEFLVVLPETDPEAALIYAERVRALVEKLGLRLKKLYPLHSFTISVGITSFNHDNDDIDSFLRRADNAMYSAKQRGRNRICSL